MKLKFNEAYVIVSHSKWTSSYCSDDLIYTDKAEADAACAEGNKLFAQLFAQNDDNMPDTVMLLDDFISMVKSDALYEGELRGERSGDYS